MLYRTKNPHGGDLYSYPVRLDFSANTNPLGTPEAVHQAVIEAVGRLSQYPDPYCRELVAALSTFEQVPTDHILCGNGAAELIYSFCTAVKPGYALELAPTFSEYTAALKSVGCQVERYTLKAEENFTLTEAFLPYLSQGSWDVLFLCNPNNPTGQTIKRSLLEKVCTLCQEKGIRLFVDECFLDLTDDGSALSLKDKLAAQPGLFLLKAFTKSYGLAGLRLGYCLSSDQDLLTAMGQAVQPWNVSILAQAAGVAALREQVFLEQTRQMIQVERCYLHKGLESLGLTVLPSSTNYLLFYSPQPVQEGLLKKGIQIRDCSNYHGLGMGWYRIAVKQHHENQQLLSAMKELE